MRLAGLPSRHHGLRQGQQLTGVEATGSLGKRAGFFLRGMRAILAGKLPAQAGIGLGLRLHQQALQLLAQAGKLAEVRLLMVPGRSDFLDATGALEEALTTFLLSLGPVPIRLNGFRHHGVRGEALSWPEAGSADLTVLANALKAKGFGSVMLPAI